MYINFDCVDAEEKVESFVKTKSRSERIEDFGWWFAMFAIILAMFYIISHL